MHWRGQAASTTKMLHLLQKSNMGTFLDDRLPGQADIRVHEEDPRGTAWMQETWHSQRHSRGLRETVSWQASVIKLLLLMPSRTCSRDHRKCPPLKVPLTFLTCQPLSRCGGSIHALLANSGIKKRHTLRICQTVARNNRWSQFRRSKMRAPWILGHLPVALSAKQSWLWLWFICNWQRLRQFFPRGCWLRLWSPSYALRDYNDHPNAAATAER